MILKLEDYVWAVGPSHEYINSDKIKRIRILKKRIKIYFNTWNYIYVGNTEHNKKELKKLDERITWL
jgi:hypothetical protein